MGHIIVKHTVDGKDRYVIWSSIVDAPITYGCTLRQIKNHWQTEYGRSGLEELERALESGTKRIHTVAQVSTMNRAGKGETHLTDEQIVDYYFVRKGKGAQPVGKTWDQVEAEEEAQRKAQFARERETVQWGAHCLHPDTCNPSKGRHGCICTCDGCRYMKEA